MSNKITKRAMLKVLLDSIHEDFSATVGEVEITAKDAWGFINHEIELLERKTAANRKPTQQQLENEKLKSAIVEGMEAGRLYTVTEVMHEVEACHELTNQRCSALMRQLDKAGILEKIVEKRKTFYRVR